MHVVVLFLLLAAVAGAMNDPRTMGMGTLTVCTGDERDLTWALAFRENPAGAIVPDGLRPRHLAPSFTLTQYGQAASDRVDYDSAGLYIHSRGDLLLLGSRPPALLRWVDDSRDWQVGGNELQRWEREPPGLAFTLRHGTTAWNARLNWSGVSHESRDSSSVSHSSGWTKVAMPEAELGWARALGRFALGASAIYADEFTHSSTPERDDRRPVPGAGLGATARLGRVSAGVFGWGYRHYVLTEHISLYTDDFRVGVGAQVRPRGWLSTGVRCGFRQRSAGLGPKNSNPYVESRIEVAAQGSPLVAAFEAYWTAWQLGNRTELGGDSLALALGAGWRGRKWYLGVEGNFCPKRWYHPTYIVDYTWTRWATKVGGEYSLGVASLRAGAFCGNRRWQLSDPTYKQDLTQWGVTTGLGFSLGSIHADVGYVFSAGNRHGYPGSLGTDRAELHEVALKLTAPSR